MLTLGRLLGLVLIVSRRVSGRAVIAQEFARFAVIAQVFAQNERIPKRRNTTGVWMSTYYVKVTVTVILPCHVMKLVRLMATFDFQEALAHALSCVKPDPQRTTGPCSQAPV